MRYRLALTALLVLAATPAAAQQVCANRTVIVQALNKDFSEVPSSMGMSDNGNVVEVLTTKDGRTWTILMTMPDGTSCVMATGQAWEEVAQQLAGSEL